MSQSGVAVNGRVVGQGLEVRVDEQGRDRRADGHDRPDRQVDAAGRDDEGHPDREEHDRRPVAQDVDEVAVEVPVDDLEAEEARVEDEVEEQDRREDDEREDELALGEAMQAAGPGDGHASVPAIACMTTASSISPDSSSTLTRSRRTTTRWLVRRTSSSSDEMNRQALPVLGEGQDESLDLRLGPDVDAARRLVEDEDLGVRGQPAGQDDLLLVAAAQGLDRLVGRRRGDPEQADVLVGDAVLLGEAQGAEPAAPGLERQDDVLADGQVVDDALGLAVLGGEGDATGDRGERASGARPPDRRPSASRCPACRCRTAGRPSRSGPDPSSPARPTTSPARSSRSNGSIASVRPSWLAARRTSPVACWLTASLSRDMSSSSVRFRPSIRAIRSIRDSEPVANVPTSPPLRRTVMRSLISSTWSRKWVMKTIVRPSSRSLRMTRKSCSVSWASRLDVGSSRMSNRAEECSSDRAIAAICWIATGVRAERLGHVDVDVEAGEDVASPGGSSPASRSGPSGGAPGR